MTTDHHTAQQRYAQVNLGLGDDKPKATFSYPAASDYWKQRAEAFAKHQHEPEIWSVLKHFLKPDSIFIDGGAESGLWSCVATTVVARPEHIIAVEANPSMHPHLEVNCRNNGNGFTIENKALWSKSDQTVDFFEMDDANSQTSSVMQTAVFGDLKHKHQVQTTTIDALVHRATEQGAQGDVIVKLDVEGAEIEAIQGAQRTLQQHNAVIIYEDGRLSDPNSSTTSEILNMGLHVYYVDPHENVCKINDARELEAIKVPPRRGYNFIACQPGSVFDIKFARLCEHEATSDKSWEARIADIGHIQSGLTP